MTEPHLSHHPFKPLGPWCWVRLGEKPFLLFLVLFSLVSGFPAQAKDAETRMKRLGFSSAQVQSALGGTYVTGRLPSATPRELAVKIAARVPIPPKALASALTIGMALKENSKVVDFGPMQNPMTPDDLTRLSLSPKQIARWKSARPGETTNLSTSEFATLESALGKGDPSDAAAITGFVRDLLLTRTRQYQISGLGGMPPYARGDQKTGSPSRDLREAVEASRRLDLLSEESYELLLAYPDQLPEQFEEKFFWVLEKGPDGRLVNLTHRFSVPYAGGFVAVQRQFYVTNGYNVEQAISLILPFDDGSLVLYTNRTSTDQVEGFGGALRRRIGDSLMESELESILHRVTDRLHPAPSD